MDFIDLLINQLQAGGGNIQPSPELLGLLSRVSQIPTEGFLRTSQLDQMTAPYRLFQRLDQQGGLEEAVRNEIFRRNLFRPQAERLISPQTGFLQSLFDTYRRSQQPAPETVTTFTAPPLQTIAPIQTASAAPTPGQQFFAPARPTDVPKFAPTRADAMPNSPFIQGIDDPRIRASIARTMQPALAPHPLATLDASAPTRGTTGGTMPERDQIYYR